MLDLYGLALYTSAMEPNAHQIIENLGGTFSVAKIFNITPGAVSQWRVLGIPKARLMYLEAVYPHAFVCETNQNTFCVKDMNASGCSEAQ